MREISKHVRKGLSMSVYWRASDQVITQVREQVREGTSWQVIGQLYSPVRQNLNQ